ncbi:MAG: pyridoxal phosphate-dependent aminotransferase [Proteobacteria bacterium]|nr:MAG: pyridoxal phosphate-dependent aminotransferase [Pseudomonadota bacterium]
MLPTLSQRISQLQPSPTVALNTKAKELADQGHKIINFSVGEPDFPTPEPIVKAAIKALEAGKTRYGGAGGGLPLRKAICEKLLKENELTYTPEQIVVGIGAKEILFHLSLALLNPGDEVLIPAPYWVSYTEHVIAAGGTPIVIPMPADHKAPRLTKEMIAPYLTAKTKAIVITSPSNPGGYVIPPNEVKALGDYLADKNIWILSDEIYEYMSFDGPSISMATLCPAVRDRFILINGFSKGFAMTGWRVGYMAGPKPVADLVRTLQTQSSTCLPPFVEEGALEALRHGRQLMADKMVILQERRDLAVSILKKFPELDMLPPNGAFYIFIDLRKVLAKSALYTNDNSLDFSKKLLETYHVAMVPGEAFGAPGFIRLSYAVHEDTLKEGLSRLGDALVAIGGIRN